MSLKPLEVKTVNIATKAVTSEKIADNAIETRNIKDGSVTPDKLTITPVTRPLTPGLDSAEIKDASVTSTKIAPNAVTSDHIAANSVATDDIKDSAITTAKIRDGAITREKVADQSVRTEDLVDGAVTNAKIAANTITAAKIAANAVGSSELAPNSVGYSEIASQSLEPRSIKTLSGAPPTPGQVPVYDETGPNYWWFRWANAATRPLTPPVATEEIANGAVVSDKIAANVVDSSKLANNAVTSDKIQDASVGTNKIQNGAITQEKLAPGVGGGDTLMMFPAPVTALDIGGIIATTAPATVDLSAIIPVGTKGVIVSIACINQSYVNGGMMAYIYRQVGAEYALQVGVPPVNAPGISNGGSVLMPVADDRTLTWLAYVAGNNSTELVIYILGYIM
ncbi:MAG: hypothetical protein AAB038_00155 [Planctomycetota bacterium]